MVLQFNPIFFGTILFVALGTAVYHAFTTNSTNNQNRNYHYRGPRTTNFEPEYVTIRRNNTDEENEELKKRKTNPGKCSICLDELKINLHRLDCNHVFHKRCIQSWFEKYRSRNCPICRVQVTQ